MTEATNELIYEILKAMQDRLSWMEGTLGEVKGELSAIRGHALATQQDTSNIYATLARHEVRLERIERRLELAELQPA